ncbi:MAG: hypothetical protein UHY68_06770 [Acutalibacteraceae bacterium]|nr:hypothetical protein [Acutalibacteraceae bacterium]
MNKKFKKITAILMSALIVSSVATLTACTDTINNDKSKATEASTEATSILRAESGDDIYVEGVFPEGAMLFANFMSEYFGSDIPLYESLYWYENWFSFKNVDSKIYLDQFTLSTTSADYEDLSVKMKVFVPYDKPDCHIIYFDDNNNPKEISSEYINGKYVFSLDPADFQEGRYNFFYICTQGALAEPDAKPVQQTLTDEKTGITVSGELLPDTQLTVIDYSNSGTLASDEVTAPGLYYITLIRDHKEIAPTSTLTVTIPGEAGNKVGYYHHDKFRSSVMSAVGRYKFESADVDHDLIPNVDENDTQEELTYLENSYNNNSYTITTSQLGMFGVGTEDKLDPEYLCRVDFGAPT